MLTDFIIKSSNFLMRVFCSGFSSYLDHLRFDKSWPTASSKMRVLLNLFYYTAVKKKKNVYTKATKRKYTKTTNRK